MVTVAAVREALAAAYPPAIAESWDTGIGLTCGDPANPVERVLLAVDIDDAVVTEALDLRVQLLVTHHPLLFRAVQSVAADTAKGALLHRLIGGGIAHLACHTNADKAVGGVNDALAALCGLTEVRPLVPDPGPELDKLVAFVPVEHAERVLAAVAAAGAGRIGEYSDAAFVSTGTGRFRPGPGAHPHIGEPGLLTQVEENRVEVVLARPARAVVLAALRAAHPYEEPAFDLIELAAPPADTGSGRIGVLARPVLLRDFARRLADRLPPTATGVRVAGGPDRLITRVALCGGAGASLLPAASAAGADVFVTADLTHHVVAEHVADPARPAVVEISHWAGEWPWLASAAAVVRAAGAGTVTTTVSTLPTDPWSFRMSSATEKGPSDGQS